MLVPLLDLPEGGAFDCCVVGTGPAGATLAAQLARGGRTVVLLEGGAREYTESSQALYRGKTYGDPYYDLNVGRLRYFGGTSNHWAGWCRPLDEIDFAKKDYLPIAHWPISKGDLDPYLDATNEILGIERLPDDVPVADGGVKQVDFVFSSVNFSDKYYAEFVAAESVALALEANVLRLETDGTMITGVVVADNAGTEKTVRARDYVLAAGGIENSRILLWSNEVANGQVVRQPATLGRYWMEHPNFTIGDGILDRRVVADGEEIAIYAPTTETMLREEVLNCGLRFQPVAYTGGKKLVSDIACVAPGLAVRLFELLNRDLVCGARLRAAWEQEPRAENHVALSNEVDRFGIPRPALYWEKTALDVKTVRSTALRLGEYFARADLGRLRLDDWVLGEGDFPSPDEYGGHHHMGGTRMADSPEFGIVDRDCRVFGQENLFVAGSSVYPTGGHANPTFTIIQLALRLADHLATRRA